MAIKIKHKGRKGRRSGSVKTKLSGDAKRVLDNALRRLNPRPNSGNWQKMAKSLASQKGLQTYIDGFIDQHGTALGWEWSSLWICHTFLCEAGQIEHSEEIYQTLVDLYPRDYHTELTRGKMFRDHKAEYFQARDHMRFAASLWPQGCEAYYHLGILYDLLGMPEFAFAMEEQAFGLVDEHYSGIGYKIKAQLSFNQAVAMWQASRPYGDIKAYLRRAIKEWPDYERAERFLNGLPENDEQDPRGRSTMQRLTDDVRKNMNRPAYQIIEPDKD